MTRSAAGTGSRGAALANSTPLRGWWKLDEGAGLVARDSSGNGCDGTITNCVWETGVPEEAAVLRFQPGGQVAFPGQASQADLAAGAVLFWFKADQPSGMLMWFNLRMNLSLAADRIVAGIVTVADAFWMVRRIPRAGAWYHVGLVWHHHKYELWINGVLTDEQLAPEPYFVQGDDRLFLGATRPPAMQFAGLMCDVRAYRAAPEEEELRAQFDLHRERLHVSVLPGGSAVRKIPLNAAYTLRAPVVRGPFYAQALKESLKPVRPGLPGRAPFWNWHSNRFIYAPCFGPPQDTGRMACGGFSEVKGAAVYVFTARAAKTGQPFEFKADKPWTPLTPIWDKLPTGFVLLSAEAFDREGRSLGSAGSRCFDRAAVFDGPYGEARNDYRARGLRAMDYLYTRPYLRRWRTEKKPDDDGYSIYCYPSKTIGAMMEFVGLYHGLSVDQPGRRAALVTMGRNMADFMIDARLRSGPMAGMPRTYAEGHALEHQVFMDEPHRVGVGYLAMSAVTRDSNYLEAALRIADAYQRLQLPSGTWCAKHLFNETGGPVNDIPLFHPLGIMTFLSRLVREHAQTRYAGVVEKAGAYLNTTVLDAFHFAGEFEDITLTGVRYYNLGVSQATRTALWLLENPTPGNVARAEEIMRFAEDQFVVWEQHTPEVSNGRIRRWQLPAVAEQTNYFVPISSLAGLTAKAFWRLYQATGKPVYRAKAVSLANSFVAAQAESGDIPMIWRTCTTPEGNRRWDWDGDPWFNILFGSAKFLIDFDNMLKEGGRSS